jgi:hypothetical protein
MVNPAWGKEEIFHFEYQEVLAKPLKPDCRASLAMTASLISGHCEEERRSNLDSFGTFARSSQKSIYAF